jgi:hypothetical protein
MARIEIKDLSRAYTTYSRADGSGEEHYNEEYAVAVDDREVLRTWSRIEAEDFARLLNWRT